MDFKAIIDADLSKAWRPYNGKVIIPLPMFVDPEIEDQLWAHYSALGWVRMKFITEKKKTRVELYTETN